MRTSYVTPQLAEINARFLLSIPIDVEMNGKVGILISCQQESIRVYPTCIILTPDGKQLQPTKFAQQASLGRRVVPYQAINIPSSQETLKQVLVINFVDYWWWHWSFFLINEFADVISGYQFIERHQQGIHEMVSGTENLNVNCFICHRNEDLVACDSCSAMFHLG
jgi:hypothetical protein